MKIKLLFTSDLHGYIFPTDYISKEEKNIGLSKLSTIIEEEKDENTLLIDLGDFIQGSVLAEYVYESSNISYLANILNTIGYDIGVLGNHGFNYGKDYVKKYMKSCNFPYLCANIKENGKDFAKEYEVIEKNGIKIGIIGLSTQYIKNWELEDNIKDLFFESAFEKAKELSEKLRDKVDILVIAYHGGFEKDLETGEITDTNIGENEGYKILKEIPGIDVILTGHQHRKLSQIIDDVAICQPGYRGEFLGKVEILLDDDKNIINKEVSLKDTRFVEENKLIKEKYSYIEESMADWLNEELGVGDDLRILDTNYARFHGHPYPNFVNKVQLENSDADISSTSIFLMEAPGLGKNITRRDILNNYPFNNTLAVIEINGRELKEALCLNSMYFIKKNGNFEVNESYLKPKIKCYNYDFYYGIEYIYDLNKSLNQRLVSLKYKGKEVKDDDKFKLVTNQYRALGGGDYWMFKGKEIIYSVDKPINRMLIDYVKREDYIKADRKINFKFIR
ncbi:bifunctional metallophosphatase/5'-nucleotidase [Anaerococcus sp. WCA-380-WT-2B]|uniref:Bifunctional metallophosphatase/5'-nucleotidase n=1 Tax=Anaerococcus porci TaxID=2652269 RepID=A0A6N7VWW8_9FIRM|nr:bifunctional UDP-sugar hydrolase/5'-nucleotidase [Anaerococcus porci]MSS78523.1 bifunctional metallophosphatase/5'-nucleotidase [Anaerococcus porci]